MGTGSEGPQASLDLTHVLYDDDSLFSLALALVTLSPILLMAAYAALAVQTREILIIIMWAGQFACEALNYVVKHIIKEERPNQSVGTGYAFPSSHSQYMGYFSAFLICHLYFRHTFSSTGFWILDQAWRALVYLAISGWAIAVAFSRYYLRYHSPHQILWGFGIGVLCGSGLYILTEVFPRRWPNSVFGRMKIALVSHPISTWLQIRDGWAIWSDGGREGEWLRWRAEWEKLHRQAHADGARKAKKTQWTQ